MDSSQPKLITYIQPYLGMMINGLFLATCQSAMNLCLPFCIRFAVDDLNAGNLDAFKLFEYTGLFLVGTLCGACLSLWMRRLPIYAAHQIEHDIRSDLFTRLTLLDPAFFKREQTGDMMTRMSSDLTIVREFIGQGVFQICRTVIVFAIAFPIMFAISRELASTLAILLPLISMVMFVLLRAIRPRYEARQELLSNLSNFTQENFAGIQTIKGYAIEDRQTEAFHRLNREFVQSNMRLNVIERPIWPLMMFLFSLGTVSILVVGGQLVIEERISLGELVQFNQYMFYMVWPIVALGWAGNLCIRGLSSWRRIQAIIETKSKIGDGSWTNRQLVNLSGDIELRHVGLIRDDQQILDDINLKIPEGATVGITGPTGSGKTMLVSMIPRLVEPSSGQILIGENDVREYSLRLLRGGIGIAQQEPFLFSDTLSSNISFGLLEPDERTTHWAADVAQLTSDIELFPDGFNTMLGERGITLSGGQRQRTAISRAIARSPEILILDDVLSAVDTQTEAQILLRLRSVVEGRTSIIVSHRISAIRAANFIVVLEGGRITQLGNHDQLANQPGYYRNLVEKQRLEAELEATK